ncbi:MAG: peptidylprolyl isomerase [Myxococcales bacterium]|nr:peptidylprolyl isomerase [Myxococcales bacterium]
MTWMLSALAPAGLALVLTPVLATALLGCQGQVVAPALPVPAHTTAEVLAAAAPDDFRPLDPDDVLVLDFAVGRVVLALTPKFAPRHVANLKALVRQGYFDGLAVVRVQDNYVVQWGDPTEKKDLGAVPRNLPPEYERPLASLPFEPLPDGDVYAPEVGWSDGFATGRDLSTGMAWPLHCYGVVGVGRDEPPSTGDANELYAVSGHAPRHLDRNLALVGRVIQGFDQLTALPRGTEALGFYARPEQRVPLVRARLAADMAEHERPRYLLMRTDTPTWRAFVASRRTRREPFFAAPTGRVEVCNVAVPVRAEGPVVAAPAPSR